jgi:hypothetical protein
MDIRKELGKELSDSAIDIILRVIHKEGCIIVNKEEYEIKEQLANEYLGRIARQDIRAFEYKGPGKIATKVDEL